MRNDTHGAGVSLINLHKSYGDSIALRDITLDIRAGELITLLGPSGSGKTTTMMAIAGFVGHVDGQILIDGVHVEQLPPETRDIGVVFQHLALFPHMTVAENVAFPLRMRGVKKDKALPVVRESLALVNMSGLEERYPHQLSGGQQQRVAFARAIAFKPRILLLDEPLAALDKSLRERMQDEIRQLHRRLGITIVNVTHDQTEAMAMSDRIVVMNNGSIEQVGTPGELYHYPENSFVANFIGHATMFKARVLSEDSIETAGGLVSKVLPGHGLAAGQPIMAMLRPENLMVGAAAGSAANQMEGVIQNATFEGDRIKLVLAVNDLEAVQLIVPSSRENDPPSIGQRLRVGWGAETVRLLRESDAERI